MDSHKFFPLELPNELEFPNDSREALIGPMSFPSAVQVSVDVHAVHPSGSYLCLGQVPACESHSLLDGGAFHSLGGGLALSWRWAPSRASP